MYWENIVKELFPGAEDMWENWGSGVIGFTIMKSGIETELLMDISLLRNKFNSPQVSISIKTKVRVSNDSYEFRSLSVDFILPRCIHCYHETTSGMTVKIVTEVTISNLKFPGRPE